MMHASIHDGLIESLKEEMTKPGYYGHSRYITVKEIHDWVSSELTKEAEWDAAKDNPNEENIKKLLERTQELIDNLGGFAPPRGPFFKELCELLKHEYQGSVPLDHEDVHATIEEYAKNSNDLTAIQVVMSRMRKQWLPLTEWSGSQQENYSAYLVLIDLMREKCFDNMTEEGPVGVYRRIVKGEDY
jgi:DUF438 domain-containing protein